MYKSLDVLNSGGGVVPNSVVYKYSDPLDTPLRLSVNVLTGGPNFFSRLLAHVCNVLRFEFEIAVHFAEPPSLPPSLPRYRLTRGFSRVSKLLLRVFCQHGEEKTLEKRTIFLTDVVIPAVGREMGRERERGRGRERNGRHARRI